MRENGVKAAFRAGQFQLGCAFSTFRSAEIPRLLAAAGYQWIFVDTEHGNFDLETVQDICRVSNLVNLCPVVRVADYQYSLVARALDCGAGGIMLPRAEDPKQMETALSWTFYPPEGVRGYGVAQNNANYESLSFTEIISHYNANLLRIAQIETVRSVEMLDEILSVRGLEAVMVGPADLSVSMGIPGNFEDARFIATIEKIVDACRRHNVIPGMHTHGPAMARFWRDRGMLLLSCSTDINMLWEKASGNARAILEN